MWAMSMALPIRFIGCRCALASFFSGVFNKEPANGVSVNEGAMQLTRIVGANSAASALVRPSKAPFVVETCE